jgi:hypothetical protein
MPSAFIFFEGDEAATPLVSFEVPCPPMWGSLFAFPG